MTEQLLEDAAQVDSEASDLTYFAFAASANSGKPAAFSAVPGASPLPEVLCGRYQIERLLGIGGMGAVYRARDLLREQYGEPEPYIALKALTEDFAEYPDANALLYTEFALTSRLSHEHVIRVYSFEVDTHSQRAFITLELLKGCTLAQLLLSHPQGLPWAQALEVSQALLAALSYAHTAGVLHGDIKPSNLMLGDEGVRLFDFGLGQAEEQRLPGLPRLCRSRFAAWTPRYAAPELLEGAALSPAADVYAAACVIYELCSGQHPLRRLSAKQAKAVELPLSAAAGLPKSLWPILRAGLAYQASERCSLAALLAAFNDYQAPSSRLPRWLTRQAE
jgi:serine/threonine-protein kinase Stk1